MASIYIIENKINRKRYVGKTTLSDPYDRWRQHKYHATKHWNNMVIGRALNKYGTDNFTFYVIETCDDDNVDERETYWIEKFNTYYDGYNSTLGGDGIKRDIELAYHPNTKPISCYTLEGEWAKDYKSRGVAARELNSTSPAITACIKGVSFQCAGYRWTWKGDELKDITRRQCIRGKIYGIDKDGNRKEWNSQADCAEDLTGNRKANANVRISVISPNDNKLSCCGWYLFRDEIDDFTPAQKHKFTSEQAREYGLRSRKN